jgi:predicted ferric reductase
MEMKKDFTIYEHPNEEDDEDISMLDNSLLDKPKAEGAPFDPLDEDNSMIDNTRVLFDPSNEVKHAQPNGTQPQSNVKAADPTLEPDDEVKRAKAYGAQPEADVKAVDATIEPTDNMEEEFDEEGKSPIEEKRTFYPDGRYQRLKTFFQDFADDKGNEVVIKAKGGMFKNMMINTKMRYSRVLIAIIIISILIFLLFAILEFFKSTYDLFGVGILFAKGAAIPILLLTMLALFFVTYELTTCCRTACKTRCSAVFDFQILFHRVSGFLITFYSFVHTIGHLSGTFRALDNEKDLDVINAVFSHKEFKHHKSYAELLFATIPGLTGIILLFIITVMAITSTERVRRKSFQLFAVVHVFGFPLFVILTIVHGSDTWLNYGFPFGAITIAISLLVFLFFWIKKLALMAKGKMQVDHFNISKTSSFIYLHIKKQKGYNHLEGEYVFLNCPDISYWQWHPFSVCSSELSPYVSFLIKNGGDFTGKLIELFKKYDDSNKKTVTGKKSVILNIL